MRVVCNTNHILLVNLEEESTESGTEVADESLKMLPELNGG